MQARSVGVLEGLDEVNKIDRHTGRILTEKKGNHDDILKLLFKIRK